MPLLSSKGNAMAAKWSGWERGKRSNTFGPFIGSFAYRFKREEKSGRTVGYQCKGTCADCTRNNYEFVGTEKPTWDEAGKALAYALRKHHEHVHPKR